jgi:hypothetical protein
MTYPKQKYSAQDKELFWKKLGRYRDALASGKGIVIASLEIHSALAYVPKSYRRFVTYAFNHTVQGKP